MAEIQQSCQLNEVEEQDNHVRSIEVLSVGLRRQDPIVYQNEIDIQNLKKQLEEKDEEIELLNKRIREIRQKNNSLEVKLKSKDKVIERLSKRIKELENDKKELQEKVTKLENKVEMLERSSLDKDKEIQTLNDKIQKLNEDVEEVKDGLKFTEDDMTDMKTKNKKLQEELKALKASRQRINPTHRALPQSQERDQERDIWLIQVGQLCRMIQDKMYQKVLPDKFDEYTHYKVKHIKEHMSKENQLDENRWRELQRKLNWNDKKEELIKFLEKQRNYGAHPPIDVAALEKYSDTLIRDRRLKGMTAGVMELFEIWKRLNQC